MSARRTYETDAIRVHWESGRCASTPRDAFRRCLRSSTYAADPGSTSTQPGADAIADAVESCPTGALRYERLDGAPPEEAEPPTMVVPIEHGPLLDDGRLGRARP